MMDSSPAQDQKPSQRGPEGFAGGWLILKALALILKTLAKADVWQGTGFRLYNHWVAATSPMMHASQQ